MNKFLLAIALGSLYYAINLQPEEHFQCGTDAECCAIDPTDDVCGPDLNQPHTGEA